MSVEHERLVMPAMPRPRSEPRPVRRPNTPSVLDRTPRSTNESFTGSSAGTAGTHPVPYRRVTRVLLPTQGCRSGTAPDPYRQAATLTDKRSNQIVQPADLPDRPPGPAYRPATPTGQAADTTPQQPRLGHDARKQSREGTGHHDRPTLLAGPAAVAPLVDIVIPVRDAERVLSRSIAALHRFLSSSVAFPWQITIVDSASTDGTWALAAGITRTYSGVTAWRLPTRGRGTAIREAWLASSGDIVACVDVHAAHRPDGLAPLAEALMSGDCAIAIGSRRAARPDPRRPTGGSAGYRDLVRLAIRAHVRHAGCAVTMARIDTVRPLLGLVGAEDDFFGTELVLAAVHNGMQVREVPVDAVRLLGRAALRSPRGSCHGLARVGWAVARDRLRIPVADRSPRVGSHRHAATAGTASGG